MIDTFVSGDLIKRIRDGKDLTEIVLYIKSKLFTDGPIDVCILEAISYLKLFQPLFFEMYEKEILKLMALFYKNVESETLMGKVFEIYQEQIKEEYGENYTPMQASILRNIDDKQHFSFSSPTSTGKSFVFQHIIKNSKNDVVIIVPSRALINEYNEKICKIVNVKEVNVLTFVERINIKHTSRNIFILTPERARELFKNKHWLKIDLFLFDEAQLSDEKSVRGLYFDGLVRRALKTFPNSKYVYAHPFISNPEAQLEKNSIEPDETIYVNYQQRNVGQIFYTYKKDENCYFHFGSTKEVFGNRKLKSKIDPVKNALLEGGSVLFYVSKSHILNKRVYADYEQYINLCETINDSKALEMIEELKDLIGATEDEYISDMIEKMSRGIVVHHGSMPLAARSILERFTQSGFCRICFATSTLEQGINMPFDVVFLDKLELSKPLSVKNLIGRAGRATDKVKFDFGVIVVKESGMSGMRKILNEQIIISNISHLDKQDDDFDEKYQEFKNAINNNQFSDEYNLTLKDLERLNSNDIQNIIPVLLKELFVQNNFISNVTNYEGIVRAFVDLYEKYLNRPLGVGEYLVFKNSILIMIWKIKGRTFGNICQRRFQYISKTEERTILKRSECIPRANMLLSAFSSKYQDIPNQKIPAIPLFERTVRAVDVDYDRVVYDTYDYLDKLINFRLGDIFYAIFYEYYLCKKDERAKKLAYYIKYGTADKTEIWLLRYGFDFETIEWAKGIVESIDENEIIFSHTVKDLDEDKKKIIYPFYYDDDLLEQGDND